VAVAASSQAKADHFAKTFNVPKVTESFVVCCSYLVRLMHTSTFIECCRFMIFWCGSGSVDPCLLMDPDANPDPAIFVIDLQDGNKKTN
jgi:hypothetical protein